MNNGHCFPAKVVSQAPECLVLNIGSNNISSAINPNQVVIPQWYTIEALKKKSFVTKIMVNEILHRKIDDVNDALFFMCNQLKK